ncbi:MAG TPA: hypothetical protein VJO54_12400 [Burkholderiales bacterium]|nr:hypothetical protein [Burkholderiales bacterium]
MQANSVQEGVDARDVIRHLVLLGDALENIDMGVDAAEDVLVPRPRNPWKLTVLEPPQVLERGWARAIPIDATHIGICLDGGWAIEASGLLRGSAQSVSGALETLADAADRFEEIFTSLVAAALEAGLPTVVCTLVPSRHGEPLRQRIAATALAIFNDRILRQAVAANLSVVDLRIVCDEEGDYATETLLSRAGVRKVANVGRSALYEVSREPGRTRVYF